MNMLAAGALALLVERFTGYPSPLQSAIGHPVEWMGKTLQWLEQRLYRSEEDEHSQRQSGVLTIALLISIFALPALLVSLWLHKYSYGWLLEALIATPFLAQRSLREHVAAVAAGLTRSLHDGRRAVSHIVGRNPDLLNEAGVSRAALESLAENTSDGVVAPLFWFLVGGLPGIVAYKAINTADSMIGHKSERYLNFGRASARLDDLVNLPASRLCGGLFAVAAVFTNNSARGAWSAMWRDARKHQSPNAGWPESSLAGALGISLGGPRYYEDEKLELAVMGEGRSELSANDIAGGLKLYDAAINVLLVACVIGALAI